MSDHESRRPPKHSRIRRFVHTVFLIILSIGAVFAWKELWPVEYGQVLQANRHMLGSACTQVFGTCRVDALSILTSEVPLSFLLGMEILLALIVIWKIIWPITWWLMIHSPQYSSTALFVWTLLVSVGFAVALYAAPRWPEVGEFVGAWKAPIFLTYLGSVLVEMFSRGPLSKPRCIADFLVSLFVTLTGWNAYSIFGAVEPVVLFTVTAGGLTVAQFVYIVSLFIGQKSRDET